MNETSLSECLQQGTKVLKRKYFDPCGQSSWAEPGQSFVSRSLAYWTRHHERHNPEWFPDIFADAFVQLWEKFPRICESFVNSGCPQTIEAFEAYLWVAIGNAVRDKLRTQRRANQRVAGFASLQSISAEEAGHSDSNLAADIDRDSLVGAWLDAALESLSDLDRDVVWGRLVDELSCEMLAVASGVSQEALHTKLWKTKLRIKTQLIEQVIRRRFSRFPNTAHAAAPLIQNRCRRSHPCYMYRIACPQARGAEELAAQFGTRSSAKQVTADLDSLAELVQNALDDWGLGVELDSCIHAL